MTQHPSSNYAFERARRRTLTGAALAFLTLGLVVPFAAGATEAPVEEVPAVVVEITEPTPVEAVETAETTVPAPVVEAPAPVNPATNSNTCLTGQAGKNALSASGPSVANGVITSTVTNNASSPVCQNVFMAVYIKTNDNNWPNSGLQKLVQGVRWDVAESSGLAAGASTVLTADLPITIDGRVCPVQIDVAYDGMRGEPFKNLAYPYEMLDPETSKNKQSADYNWGDLIAALHYPTPTGNALPGCGELQIEQRLELSGCTAPSLDQLAPIWFKIEGTPAAGAGAPFVKWVNMTPAAPNTTITKKYYASVGTYVVKQVDADGSNTLYSDALLSSSTRSGDDGIVVALVKDSIVIKSVFTKCEATTTTTTTTTAPTTTTTTTIPETTSTTTIVEQESTTTTTITDPTTTSTMLGQATKTPPVAVKGQQLARTGQRSAQVLFFSTMLLLTGGALLGVSRRPGRRRPF